MSARSDAVLVILPTYNERPNIERVVAGIRRHGYDVLVVDDGSPDGTADLVESLVAADPAIRLLRRPLKMGLGSAYVAGMRQGLEHGYGLFVEMDADGSHLPTHLDDIVAAARNSGGMAVGSRYIAGGSIVGWGPQRWLLSFAANVYCRTVLWLPTKDCTSGFRCYTRRVLESIGLERVLSEGYSFQIEMVYRCSRLGFPVIEVPIRFEDRTEGVSKVSQGEVRKALTNVLRLRLGRWR